MDAFILAFRNLCNDLMPILGAICLVCLIILLIKLIRMIGDLDLTVLRTHGTIDLVDKSIEKVQAPLDTVARLSTSVDKAHDATIEVAKEAKDYIDKNAGKIKDKVVAFISDSDSEDEELKQPDPENLIGDNNAE